MFNFENITGLIERQSHEIKEIYDLMTFICKLLYDNISYYNWVGFYILKDGKLHLGPFIGKPTEHVKIGIGEGICGMAAETLRPILVADVTNENNYIACNAETLSEIVVPIMVKDKFWGEIDIDSNRVNAFSENDKLFLEKITNIIAKSLKYN